MGSRRNERDGSPGPSHNRKIFYKLHWELCFYKTEKYAFSKRYNEEGIVIAQICCY
jgi:hypothetical protein